MKINENRLSHNICEIRYKPNPNIIDNRGLLAEVMSKLFKLEHWGINENGIQVFDPTSRIKISVSWERMSISVYNDYGMEELKRLLNQWNQLKSSLSFLSEIEIKRIGIRTRNCAKHDGAFTSLFKQFKKKYFPVPEEMTTMSDFELYDVGFPLHYKKGNTFLHTNCGPMEKTQIFENFKEFYKIEDIVEVGTYLDIDSFENYDKPGVNFDDVKKIEELFNICKDNMKLLESRVAGE